MIMHPDIQATIAEQRRAAFRAPAARRAALAAAPPRTTVPGRLRRVLRFGRVASPR